MPSCVPHALPATAPDLSAATTTVADIARETFLSEGTVRNYLSSAIGKTSARTRAEAARIAQDNGWLLPR